MCRWNAFIGKPLLIDELLYRPEHGLIDESLHARMASQTTNGDGFGLGWYPPDMLDSPGRYRSIAPAWNDANLRDLTRHIESPLFLAHIRAAVGSPVQQTNCHPFRHGRWLFVHNGMISGFAEIRRELMLAIDPDLFPSVAGSTDTETLFYLALGFGLEEDPLGAMEQAVGVVERVASKHGNDDPVQMTIGIADGERLWAIRYASRAEPNSLFVSEDVNAVQRLHPENPRLKELTEGDRIVVSEPLIDLPGAWNEVPPSTGLMVAGTSFEQRPFQPR